MSYCGEVFSIFAIQELNGRTVIAMRYLVTMKQRKHLSFLPFCCWNPSRVCGYSARCIDLLLSFWWKRILEEKSNIAKGSLPNAASVCCRVSKMTWTMLLEMLRSSGSLIGFFLFWNIEESQVDFSGDFCQDETLNSFLGVSLLWMPSCYVCIVKHVTSWIGCKWNQNIDCKG